MTHELDAQGQPVHVDIDAQIPTGICSICEAENEEEEVTP